MYTMYAYVIRGFKNRPNFFVSCFQEKKLLNRFPIISLEVFKHNNRLVLMKEWKLIN